MPKFIAIGEALIDFMPSSIGRLAQIESFTKCPGGAPSNVAAAVAGLGHRSMVITKLGQDAFGDYLVDEMSQAGIDTSAVLRTSEAMTALAFVSHTEDGDRDFMFYRSPSADMLLAPEEICPEWFEKGDILHFCSVDLVDYPCRHAHERAIALAREKGALVSFDVNLRFPLWKDLDELKETVLRFIPMADIVKVSDEELDFLGEFDHPCRIVTMGKQGASYRHAGLDLTVQGFATPAVDTTGAGDSFIGAFLAQVLVSGLPTDEVTARHYLRNCHAVASIVVGRYGALNSMPKSAEVVEFIKKHGCQS